MFRCFPLVGDDLTQTGGTHRCFQQTCDLFRVCIQAVPGSGKPESEKLQAEIIHRVLKLRPDLIVAATLNPYDIRRFPGIETYLATYGYRQVQVEALFKALTGAIPPSGRLPVEIKGLFPRGYSAAAPEVENP